MTEHVLKIHSQFLPRILSGQKTFEIRKNDRDFQVGDTLLLCEHNPNSQIQWAHPGKQQSARVGVVYISSFAQQEGYVVLGIKLNEDEKPFTRQVGS